MTDKEKRNEATPKRAAEHTDSTKNMLSDFGADTKKSASSSTSSEKPKSAPTTPPTQASSSGGQASASSPSPKKPTSAASEKKDAKKATSSDTAKVKNASVKEKKPPETAHATTATATSPKAEKKDKPAKEQDAQPRSSRPAHQVIPYVFGIFAILIGISLLLNLFCNRGNVLENDPASHWMGMVGYYICYWMFGWFGPAVFVLPLLLANLAIFWKKYIDRRIAISKILVSAIFLLLLGAFIHICCLISLEPQQWNMTSDDLIYYGAKMTGGGLFGGALGYLMVRFLNLAGSMILSICLLAVSLFYFLGMTPEHLWSSYRKNRSRRTESLSRKEAEDARNKAAMDEKIRRIAARQMTIDDEQESGKSDAVEVVKDPSAQKKSPEDKLAPMPQPRLDPGDGSRPYVSREVSRKLNEEHRANAQSAAKPAPAVSPAPAATPAQPPNPAKNRDTAVDPIFPKATDTKTLRRIPKEDRNFDLENVFINLDDKKSVQPRRHAPVPPEVPLAPKHPAPTATEGASTTTATAQTQKAAPAPTVNVKPAPTGSVKAPSVASVKPATSSSEKPIFRQADQSGQKDFGLSSEEFEKIEASQTQLPKTSSTKTITKADGKPSATATDSKGDAKTASVIKVKPAPKTTKQYVFPPISYLQPGQPMTAENRAEIDASMTQLAETLASFHVKVKEINYSCGPTVTRYEVILAAGVRVRTITGLADDIALALRSSGGVRIEAPIPGTNAVGIEVPNRTRSTIYLRDMIESKAFAESKSKLAACLGADIAGQPLIFDIAKMPHLLVAGTTGSGKSVCINCIIMSLLYKVRPDEVKLVLIDPKKVEFSIYKNIPHLMAPVVTQPKDAAGALQAAVEEMERRFEVFESIGVRDLKGYNEITKDDPDMPFIPHIVIIIDELADLMMTAKNEVETAICRIAQKARAAGMHLIIGTQRPSADVVTGLIKANVPSSIAFAVKSQVDSRVILDHGGAEALTGRGDMLFVPIGAMRDTRVQGAFVDDKEVEKICEFIRVTNGTAQYDERFISKLKELAAQCGNKGKGGGGDDTLPAGSDDKGDDSKYADAVRVAVEEKRISTSLLQRKLEIGYSRAAKLIDRMQEEGIVSPPDGSKPRAILITPEEYLARFVDNADSSDNAE